MSNNQVIVQQNESNMNQENSQGINNQNQGEPIQDQLGYNKNYDATQKSVDMNQNSQAIDPNQQQYYDPNQQYYDPNQQQYYDPNQQYYDPNQQQYYDPNQQLQYYDPNQQQEINQNQNQVNDPNQQQQINQNQNQVSDPNQQQQINQNKNQVNDPNQQSVNQSQNKTNVIDQQKVNEPSQQVKRDNINDPNIQKKQEVNQNQNQPQQNKSIPPQKNQPPVQKTNKNQVNSSVQVVDPLINHLQPQKKNTASPVKKPKYFTIPKIETPRKFFDHFKMLDTKTKYKISKLQIAIQNYNKMKDEMKKLFQKEPPNTETLLIKDITSMLSILDSLNLVLDVVIEQQKFTKIIKRSPSPQPNRNNQASNSPLNRSFGNNNNNYNVNFHQNNFPKSGLSKEEMQEQSKAKLLNSYKKQYDNLYKRLLQIKDEDYIERLKKEVNDLNSNITILQKENRVFQTNQHISEKVLNKKYKKESVTTELDKLINDHHRFELVIKELDQQIQKSQDEYKENEEKINQSKDALEELKTNSSDYKFEEIKKQQEEEEAYNKNVEKIKDIKEKIKRLGEIRETNKKRFEDIKSKNEIIIKNLKAHEEKFVEEIKKKQEENEKMKKEAGIVMKKVNTEPQKDNKDVKNEKNNNNISVDDPTFTTQMGNRPQPIIVGSSSSSHTRNAMFLQNNNQSFSKKSQVLASLTRKQMEEEANNKTAELPGTNTSIVIKNGPYKPNLDFGTNKLNKKNTVNSNKNALGSGEIAEDIKIDGSNKANVAFETASVYPQHKKQNQTNVVPSNSENVVPIKPVVPQTQNNNNALGGQGNTNNVAQEPGLAGQIPAQGNLADPMQNSNYQMQNSNAQMGSEGQNMQYAQNNASVNVI